MWVCGFRESVQRTQFIHASTGNCGLSVNGAQCGREWVAVRLSGRATRAVWRARMWSFVPGRIHFITVPYEADFYTMWRHKMKAINEDDVGGLDANSRTVITGRKMMRIVRDWGVLHDAEWWLRMKLLAIPYGITVHLDVIDITLGSHSSCRFTVCVTFIKFKV